jgi:hypothetical protein
MITLAFLVTMVLEFFYEAVGALKCGQLPEAHMLK